MRVTQVQVVAQLMVIIVMEQFIIAVVILVKWAGALQTQLLPRIKWLVVLVKVTLIY